MWIDEDFSKINLIIDDLMTNTLDENYLKYTLSYFPTNIENEKNNNDENEDKEEDDENSWEFSSPAITEGEEDIKENKSDNKEKFNDADEFGERDDFEDVKPIVKY